MRVRTTRWLVVAASAALILGAILARVIDPGARVEKVMLTMIAPLEIGRAHV